MRRTLILTLAVLACALAVCWAAQATLNGTVEKARRLHAQALLAENIGDRERAWSAATMTTSCAPCPPWKWALGT